MRVNKIALSFVLVGFMSASNAALITDSSASGYGDLVMGRNDDGSSNQLNLPFDINFYGNTYSTFYVNNNGNITFNAPISTFTPDPFPISSQPMIAPYWGDVDTRCTTCGEVYVSSLNPGQVMITWDSVGYYSSNSSKTNTFQAVLIDRSDTGAGNFDVEFRYDQLEWTTGDASGGSGGLGGTPAQAGYDAGDLTNFFTLPGSRTAEVLNLANTTNVIGGDPGVWSFSIRDGELPGSTPENPLMPVEEDGSWAFDFNIGDVSDQVFIDPLVAIGYDYVVESGPNIASVLLPTGIGDNLFDLWLFDGLDWFDTGTDITGGVAYDFDAGGVDMFRILGIETSAMLDPDDTTAFVTGLTFVDVGAVSMSQIPISINTDPVGVPEPSSLAIFALGIMGLLIPRTRRKFKHR